MITLHKLTIFSMKQCETCLSPWTRHLRPFRPSSCSMCCTCASHSLLRRMSMGCFNNRYDPCHLIAGLCSTDDATVLFQTHCCCLQDANECWTELVRCLQKKVPPLVASDTANPQVCIKYTAEMNSITADLWVMCMPCARTTQIGVLVTGQQDVCC